MNPFSTFLCRKRMRRCRGSRGKWGRRAPPALVLAPKNPFKDVFDNTCDISDFRAHIYCPQTTQELSEKHYDAGRPDDAY